MSRTAVYLKNALEPLYLNEPLQATMINMSASQNHGMHFFGGEDTEGRSTVIAIANVLFMRDEEEI